MLNLNDHDKKWQILQHLQCPLKSRCSATVAEYNEKDLLINGYTRDSLHASTIYITGCC